MKSLSVFLFLILFQNSLRAETFESQIHSYDSQFRLLRFKNGRAAFLGKKERPDELHFKMLEGQNVKVMIDEENRIKMISLLPETSDHKYNKSLSQVSIPFEPTVLENDNEVHKIFNRLNSNYKRSSECSDRAHVWAFDEFKNHGIQSYKAFIFFTASYINRHKFKWWFHVAPMVLVKSKGQITKAVLDHTYKDSPTSIKDWTDMMVFSKRDCKLTTRFSEYDVNPQTEDCYMMIESMYYRLPADVHLQELRGLHRNHFYDHEVLSSRNASFKRQGE